MSIIQYLKKPHDKFIKGLEYSILVSVFSYFILLILHDHEMIGLHEPIVDVPVWTKTLNEVILYIMISLLSFELLIKYLKIGNARIFFKKHWHDIALVVLIPVFAFAKIFKVLGIAKKIKFAKYGFKAAQKTKKQF